MTYTFKSTLGTLELPRYQCLVCISAHRFWECSSCELMDQLGKEAKEEWEEEWERTHPSQGEEK